MSNPPAWAVSALRYLGPVLVLLLIVEAALGGWTNVSGPPTFTPSTSIPALLAHEGVGYLLGLLALVALVSALMVRKVPNIIHSVLILVGVGVAGVAGRGFIDNSSNPPVFAALMTAMFVLALLGALGMTIVGWRASRAPPGPTAATASG